MSRMIIYMVLFVLSAVAVTAAQDFDGDGVPADRDVCPATAPGTIVNYWGRPVADINEDCLVDLRDFAFFQSQMGGGSPDACPSGHPCDDGNECTYADVCAGGACVGVPVPDLPYGLACGDNDSLCAGGQCLPGRVYVPGSHLGHWCSNPDATHQASIQVPEFTMVSDGETLWVYGFPAIITGDGAFTPGLVFSLEGERTIRGCREWYWIVGQFGDTANELIMDLGATYDGDSCAGCGWPSWGEMPARVGGWRATSASPTAGFP